MKRICEGEWSGGDEDRERGEREGGRIEGGLRGGLREGVEGGKEERDDIPGAD